MEYISYSIKILLYIIIVCVLYYVGGNKIHFVFGHRKTTSVLRENDNKISMIKILFISLIFGLYSTIVSSVPYAADRGNYARRFEGNWDNPFSTGLNILSDILHKFSNDANTLFFAISFICILLTLIAYKISDEGKEEALLYIGCSEYLIFSFSGLKQSSAMAFGVLAIVLLLKKKYILSAICIFVAIQFHEAAYVLIPICFMLIGSKIKWVRILSYFIMAAFLFVFSGMTRFSLGIISRYIPDLTQETLGYMDSSGAIATSINIFTAIKGIPYYIITIVGFSKRETLKDKINNYDKYLVLSTFLSITTILSMYMYWLYRFAIFCYVPTFIFASELYNADDSPKTCKKTVTIAMTVLALLNIRYLILVFFKYGGFG